MIDRLKLRLAGRSPSVDVEPNEADFSVLFVCMGNICRSPTVEGVFRKLVAQHLPDLAIHVDSA